MTLGQKQREFTLDISKLIAWAYRHGYELTFGDAKRPANCPYGRKTSLHKSRLAIDLNLFKDGVYLTQTSHHTPLGEYWESLRPENSWGGRFMDGNHYSRRHNGRR